MAGKGWSARVEWLPMDTLTSAQQSNEQVLQEMQALIDRRIEEGDHKIGQPLCVPAWGYGVELVARSITLTSTSGSRAALLEERLAEILDLIALGKRICASHPLANTDIPNDLILNEIRKVMTDN